jgi:hypothetical protein
MELSKKDKKTAREIIEKGLQIEYANGLNQLLTILQDWEKNNLSNRDAYYAIYKRVIDYDKHIARRYDQLSGSKYLFIIAGQLIDGAISSADLESLSDEAKQAVQRIADIADS